MKEFLVNIQCSVVHKVNIPDRPIQNELYATYD